MNKEKFISLIKIIDDNIRLEEDFLNNLDAAIGDSDHGTNMVQAFTDIRHNLTLKEKFTLSEALEILGNSMIEVGGSEGTHLYGVGLLSASEKIDNEDDNVSIEIFYHILEYMRREIHLVGEVEVGDKTLYDVLDAATTSLKESKGNSLEKLEIMVREADRTVIHTKDMIAKKGRASYFGESSKGYIDPGAYSMYVILSSIFQFVKEVKILEMLNA